jgi:hypothetical protein
VPHHRAPKAFCRLKWTETHRSPELPLALEQKEHS